MGGPGGPPPFAGGHGGHGGFNPGMAGGGGRQIYVSNVCSNLICLLFLRWCRVLTPRLASLHCRLAGPEGPLQTGWYLALLDYARPRLR